MSDCKLKKYGCTYNETGCSDCKVNQTVQNERARIIRELEELEREVEYMNQFDSGFNSAINKAIEIVRGGENE